jgi:hypothetical protein
MGDNIEKHVGVSLDAKIEAPIVVHARLPAFLIVPLCTQGGVPEISEKIGELLAEQPLYLRRRFDEALSKGFSYEYAHVRDA